MSPHYCVVLASFHVLTLLGCLPVTLGWRHDVSFGMSIANAGRRDGFLHQHTYLATDDVPDILLGCHSPVHGLGQHAEHFFFGLPKGKERELTYYLKHLTPPLHVRKIEDLLKSVAFIDYDLDATLPRRLKGYSANEKVVQFETAAHDVKDANDWDKSRYDDEFTWSKLRKFPLPDFWQLDLTDTQQDLFWNTMTYHLGNMSIADTRKYILPQYKIMTSFWQNMHSLLAPRGMVVVNNVPGFFEGHACECEKPIKGTVCSPQESLSVDLCFLKKDQAKSLLFKRFIELTEETGLKLTTPAFFNKKRKIGVGLQRVPLE